MKNTFKNWSREHSLKRINGDVVSYVDTEIGDETILFLHDFGTNSFSFYKQLEALRDDYRVIIPDLIGFGFSDKPRNYYYSILDQAQMIVKLLEQLEVKNLSVVSQGYGTSVLCEILSKMQCIECKKLNINISEITLLNGSLAIEMSKTKSSEDIINHDINTKFNQIAYSYQIFQKNFKMVLNQPTEVTDEEIEVFWNLMSINRGQRYLQFVDYSILERKQFANRWINALEKADARIQVLWGDNDRLSHKFFAKKLNELIPDSKLHMVENCGHFPSLESPEVVSNLIKETINNRVQYFYL